MTWQEALWAELDGMDETDQFTMTGEWITEITRDLLPALGKRRREVILTALSRPGWDTTTFAETVGSRRTTINRLAEEARAAARADRLAAAPQT